MLEAAALHAQLSCVLTFCAEGDDDDFIAPEDDAQVGKHRSGRLKTQLRSIRDWSDSCSETSRDMGNAKKEIKLLNQHAAEPGSIKHAHKTTADIGASSCVCCRHLGAMSGVHCIL